MPPKTSDPFFYDGYLKENLEYYTAQTEGLEIGYRLNDKLQGLGLKLFFDRNCCSFDDVFCLFYVARHS